MTDAGTGLPEHLRSLTVCTARGSAIAVKPLAVRFPIGECRTWMGGRAQGLRVFGALVMHRNRVAVFVDGGFFLKRLRYQFPNAPRDDAAEIARLIHTYCLRHRTQQTGRDGSRRPIMETFDLYRIFYYDCPPFAKKMHYPRSGKSIDFSRSPQALFRNALHDQLRRKRKVALRLGHLLDTSTWRIKPQPLSRLLKGAMQMSDLTDEDFELDISQKGVDMRLGLDVAALSYKKLVDQIILIVGDSDFVPAAKLARREGIDVIIDPLGQTIHSYLYEHTDGVRTLDYAYRGRHSSAILTDQGVPVPAPPPDALPEAHVGVSPGSLLDDANGYPDDDSA